jgi:micrococcal nuclease
VRVSFLLGGFAAAFAAGGPVAAQTATVRYVTDGDTFRLTSGERIRISGIDAPETQPGQAKCAREIVLGKRAAASLRTLVDGRAVTLNRVGRSYNRTVATVSVGGSDLAASLIAAGTAKPWPRGRPKPDWCR